MATRRPVISNTGRRMCAGFNLKLLTLLNSDSPGVHNVILRDFTFFSLGISLPSATLCVLPNLGIFLVWWTLWLSSKMKNTRVFFGPPGSVMLISCPLQVCVEENLVCLSLEVEAHEKFLATKHSFDFGRCFNIIKRPLSLTWLGISMQHATVLVLVLTWTISGGRYAIALWLDSACTCGVCPTLLELACVGVTLPVNCDCIAGGRDSHTVCVGRQWFFAMDLPPYSLTQPGGLDTTWPARVLSFFSVMVKRRTSEQVPPNLTVAESPPSRMPPTMLSLIECTFCTGPLRIDVTVTAKRPLLVLGNVTPFKGDAHLVCAWATQSSSHSEGCWTWSLPLACHRLLCSLQVCWW